MAKTFALVVSLLVGFSVTAAKEPAAAPQFESSFLRVALAPDQPIFTELAVDSLGTGKLSMDPLRSPDASGKKYEVRKDGSRFEYRAAGTPAISRHAGGRGLRCRPWWLILV